MESEKTSNFFYEKKCRVTEPLGLCARPSCCIVQEVARIAGAAGIGKIFIRKVEDGAQSDPYSIMSLMMLGAYNGAELSVFTREPTLVDKVDNLAQFIDTVNMQTNVDFEFGDYQRVLKEYSDLRKAKK